MTNESLFRNLSHDEFLRVMAICEQLHRAEPDTPFIHHCRATLHNAFGNVHFSAEIHQLEPFAMMEQVIHPLDQEDYWLPLFSEHGLDYPIAARASAVMTLDTGMKLRDSTLNPFNRSTLPEQTKVHVEARNQIWVGLRDGNELLSCIYSRAKEYSEQQLTMMCMIQPHLETAWKNWKRLRRMQRELVVLQEAVAHSDDEDAEMVRLREAVNSLTNRQCDVVELIAEGMDNQQIADQLRISVFTVKKHLQMIFKKLDILHRTELAAKWHQIHAISIR